MSFVSHYETQKRTAQAVIGGYNEGTPDSLLRYRTPECKHMIHPASVAKAMSVEEIGNEELTLGTTAIFPWPWNHMSSSSSSPSIPSSALPSTQAPSQAPFSGASSSAAATTAASSSGPNTSGNNDNNNTGAIVGGVIGGLALVGGFGVAAIYVFLEYRRNRAADTTQEEENRTLVTRGTLLPPTAEQERKQPAWVASVELPAFPKSPAELPAGEWRR
ncbi:Uu.00g018910.m01.CDS01 [Anthostomella pinea]|uniref:Uu.00g018910.m01.CDS01 n=1 Tax=Anthostomella pinea TaxID=933095 RepID=A0AAI8YNI4_9PEZI|nr:Uu.00g018910.m01.CDS01 [Anthostomella pinea]